MTIGSVLKGVDALGNPVVFKQETYSLSELDSMFANLPAPPPDQSAEITALQAQVAALELAMATKTMGVSPLTSLEVVTEAPDAAAMVEGRLYLIAEVVTP